MVRVMLELFPDWFFYVDLSRSLRHYISLDYASLPPCICPGYNIQMKSFAISQIKRRKIRNAFVFPKDGAKGRHAETVKEQKKTSAMASPTAMM